MKQTSVSKGGAEPNRQRRDVRSVHGLGVPATPMRKTCTTGLTTAIPGINHVSARRTSKHCRKADVTTAYTDLEIPAVTHGVYAPQEDTELLVDVMDKTGLALGRRVADLCTGTGVVAIAAREQGAAEVTAFDICPRAVHCARTSAAAAGFDVAVHLGSWARSVEFGPYDLVVCNPPYVPHDPSIQGVPAHLGPARAWDAGYDGRLVLDPLCMAAPKLLANGGTMLLVQSEFAGPRETLAALAGSGLDAEVIAWQWIPFGPVLSSRAQWLEDTGRLEPGRREEELLVIRADKP
jgi:release factor glutamine methyltransferase